MWRAFVHMSATLAFRIALVVLCSLLTAARGDGRAVAWLVAFVSVTVVLQLRPFRGRALLVASALAFSLSS